MSRPSTSTYIALPSRVSRDVDDEDEDAQTLIGSPASPAYEDDKNDRVSRHIEDSQRPSRQSSMQKGNSTTHLKSIEEEEEEFLDAKEWGFWEVCAVRTVRRMLASLFLLS